MSWCRWGSKCTETAQRVAREMFGLPVEPDENDACPLETCPGSDLYIVEESAAIVCHCGEHGFRVESLYRSEGPLPAAAKKIAAHIIEHDQNGYHVRRSLLAWAKKQME